jgi:hypothetical protein
VGIQDLPYLFDVYPVRVTMVGLAVNEERETLIAVGVLNQCGDRVTLALRERDATNLRDELVDKVPKLAAARGLDPEGN